MPVGGVNVDLNDFGSLQLRVLEKLWEQEKAAAGDLWEAWPERPRPAYTTVLSALQKLYKRKLVRRRKKGRAHVYVPSVDRDAFLRKYVAEVRRKVFGGSASAIVAALFDGEEVSDEEYREIERLVGRKEARRKRR